MNLSSTFKRKCVSLKLVQPDLIYTVTQTLKLINSASSLDIGVISGTKTRGTQ